MIPANAADPIKVLGASVTNRPHLASVPSAIWYYARVVPPAPIPLPPGPVGQGSCGSRCCLICALLPPSLCQDVVQGMLRAKDFGGQPGAPALPGH
jgi:hypothetical protein